MLQLSTSQYCFRRQSPVAIGSSQGETHIDSIDFDWANNIGIGVRTNDKNFVLTASSSTFYPVIGYLDLQREIKWLSVIKNCGGANVVRTVKFNPSGDKIAANIATSQDTLLILKATDGTLLQQFTANFGGTIFQQNLLFDSNENLFISISGTWHLQKYSYSFGGGIPPLSYLWDIRYSGATSTSLIFAQDESTLLVGGSQSSKLAIYGIKASDGSLLWNYRDNDATITTSVQRMSLYKGTSSNYLFTCSVKTNTLYIHRLQLLSATPFPVQAYSYTFAGAPTCYDVFGLDQDNAYSIISRSFYYFVKVNFSTLKLFVTQMSTFNGNMHTARIYDQYEAYYAGCTTSIGIFTTRVGFFLSYQQSLSCFALSYTETDYSTSLVAKALTDDFTTLPTNQVSSGPNTLNLATITLTAVSFSTIPQLCPAIQTYIVTVDNFGDKYYEVGTSTLTFIYNQWSINAVCIDFAISYTLQYGPTYTSILPSFITFYQATRKFEIYTTDASFLGYHQFRIIGTLPGGQTQNYDFTVYVKCYLYSIYPSYEMDTNYEYYVNYIGYFIKLSQIDYFPLCLSTVVTYQTVQANGDNVPYFMSIDDSYYQIGLFTYDMNDAKLYSFITTITIKDDRSTKVYTYPWQLNVKKNTGPPYFLSDLIDKVIYVNDFILINLPQIYDPDGDPYQIDMNFGTGTLFTRRGFTQILISPTDNSQVGTYKVIITLTDLAPSPKSTINSFFIYV